MREKGWDGRLMSRRARERNKREAIAEACNDEENESPFPLPPPSASTPTKVSDNEYFLS